MVVGTIAVLALSACTGGGAAVEPLPPPPSTQPIPSTTTPPDYALVQLPTAERGRTTTTTLALGPGAVKFEGKVVDPEGAPVAGATIRVERLVEGAVAGIDVGSVADGTWKLGGVMGGRYRVRAWRTPDLAMVTPVQVFLGATDKAPLELKLERFFGTVPKPAIAPNPPVVGQPAGLVVQVSSRTVDGSGIVRGVPVAGAPAELVGSTWVAQTPNPTVTDAGGRVRWEVVCRAVGTQALRLVVAGEPFDLDLPACAEPPPPPSPPVPGSTTPPTTSRAGPSPSTTRPATSPTTTRPRSTP